MTEELLHLWSLRELDERLVQRRDVLARLPAQRAELDTRVEAEKTRLEQLKSRMSDVQKARRERERDIEAASAQERKFQSQLPAVKKNEEYTALLHEIEAARTSRSNLETEVLMRLEEEDRIQHERPAIEQALAAAEREAGERRKQIDAEEAEQRGQMSVLEAERAKHLAGLTPPVRSRYERIHASLGGRAVVTIAKGACGGCFRGQPPQMLQEARRGDRLLTCDGCGRIMIWPPDTT